MKTDRNKAKKEDGQKRERRAPTIPVAAEAATMDWGKNRRELAARFDEADAVIALRERIATGETSDADDLVSLDAPIGTMIKGTKNKAQRWLTPVSVTINRSSLEDALRVAVDVASSGKSLPILSHLPVAADDRSCTVSATNLEASWTRTVDVVASGALSACIPAKTFMAEVRALPSEVRDVELRFSDGSVSINGRCKIRTTDGEEFPKLPTVFGNVVKVSGLTEALSRVIPAVSTDQTPYVLTGVMIDIERGKVVASDGFRLHYDDIVTEGGPALILPANAVKILLKHKGEDLIYLPAEEGKHVGFSVAGGLPTARLMEGAFPDYENVIPTPT